MFSKFNPHKTRGYDVIVSNAISKCVKQMRKDAYFRVQLLSRNNLDFERNIEKSSLYWISFFCQVSTFV